MQIVFSCIVFGVGAGILGGLWLASGVYVCRLQAGGIVQTGRLAHFK